MRTLWRKLGRDLIHNSGQLTAIAAVIACGVMVMLITSSNLATIQQARDDFYTQARLADIFVDLVRAPRSQLPQLETIEGVNQVSARVSAMARVTVEGFDDPIQGRFLSLEALQSQNLNQVILTQGQLPEDRNQVVVTKSFASAHELQPGDKIRAILNGQSEQLTISGIGLSPEFIYQIGPADLLPDYFRFGIFWMQRDALESAFELQASFNQLSLSVQPGANRANVMQALDFALRDSGTRGAYERNDLPSHRFLDDEIRQLRTMSTVLPGIFLSVAAFLLHVLISRLIRIQRQPIALLKAFGYQNAEIMRHYLSFSAVIVSLGVALGGILGTLVAAPVAELYASYFQFPDFATQLQVRSILLAALVAYISAFAGTWRAVRSIASQAPAESMRPPTPEQYRPSWFDSRPQLSQASRMIARNLARHRWRSLLSVVGIALSGALLTFGSYMFASFDDMLTKHYGQNQSMDLDLIFAETINDRELSTLQDLPGILYTQGYRQLPVRISHQRFEQQSTLLGMDANPKLSLRRLDYRGQLPEQGIILTDYLAQTLHAEPGDQIYIELLSDNQQRFSLPLVAVVSEALGMGAYMERRALNRLIGEGPAINGAWALYDTAARQSLFQRLHNMPLITGVRQITESEQEIRDYIDDTVLVVMLVLLVLAGSITVAVVYNNARIIFAERERELATLRVLGFTQTEVAWLLIAETGLIVVVAIPLAWLLGSAFSLLLLESLSNDMYRVPWIFNLQPYAFAAIGLLISSLLAVGLVIRKLQQLDMLSSLKTE